MWAAGNPDLQKSLILPAQLYRAFCCARLPLHGTALGPWLAVPVADNPPVRSSSTADACTTSPVYALPLQELRAAAEQVAAAVNTASQECVAHRRPLVRAPPKRAADIRQFNPKFEEEYVAMKDYDPDR